MSRPGSPGRRNGLGGPGATPDDMPRLPRPGQPAGEPDVLTLDMLLDRLSPPEAPPELAGLPEMLADLSGPAEPGELALEAAVLARFRSRVLPGGAMGAARTPAPRRARRRPDRRSPRLAAGLVAAAIGLGGTAAAYAGVLPEPLQDFAHRIIDAPAARHASGPHPGVVPGQRSGAAPATSPSSQPGARSAATGPTAGHHTAGKAAYPTRPAHSVTPRPRPEPSPQPSQHHPPSPTPRPSRPPQPSQAHHPSQPGPEGLTSASAAIGQVITGRGSNNPISDTSVTLGTRCPA